MSLVDKTQGWGAACTWHVLLVAVSDSRAWVCAFHPRPLHGALVALCVHTRLHTHTVCKCWQQGQADPPPTTLLASLVKAVWGGHY